MTDRYRCLLSCEVLLLLIDGFKKKKKKENFVKHHSDHLSHFTKDHFTHVMNNWLSFAG